MSCFKKYFIKKKQPNHLIDTLRLNKFIGSRTWENNNFTILRQITGIGEKFAKTLIENKIDSLPKVLETSSGLIEAYCGKNVPFGDNIKGFVHRIPNFEIKIKSRNEKTITFELENIHSGSKNNENEATNGFLVFFNKSKSVFLFKFLNLKKENRKTMEFDIHIGSDPANLPLKIAVLNEKFVGFDKGYVLNKDFTFKEVKEELYFTKCEEVEKNNTKEEKNFNEGEEIDEILENLKENEEEEEEKMVDELLKGYVSKKPQENGNFKKKQNQIKKENDILLKKEEISSGFEKNEILKKKTIEPIPEIKKSVRINNGNNFEAPPIKHETVIVNKKKLNTIKWFQEKDNYQEFYSLFEDIF